MDLKKIFFNPNDYELTNKKLGSGSYGRVYIAVNKRNSQKYAAKIIDDESIEDGNDNQSKILNESINHSKLNHPSIVKFIGVSFQSLEDLSQFKPTIITEYISNGSLRNILDNERRSICDIEWTATKKFICLIGIAHAMKYLHEKGFIHRDIKPENILIDENCHPKVADFGLSRIFSIFDSKSMTNQIGTPLYMAPELYENDKYGPEIDVYAFSMIAYEMVTGKKPFYNTKITAFKLFQKVKDGVRPEFTDCVTEKMKNLISQCWNQDPSKRPSFKEVFEKLSTDFSYFQEDIDEGEVTDYLENVLNCNDDQNENCEENEERKNDKEEEDKNEEEEEEVIENKKEEEEDKNEEEEDNDENKNEKKDPSSNIIDNYFNIDKKQLHQIKYVDVLLHMACEKGDKKMAKYLISKKQVDINLTISHKTKDKYYDIIETKTALHIAVENENINMIKFLLSNPKIDVNRELTIEKTNRAESKFRETSAKTALHIACEKRNKEIVILLLSNPKIRVNGFFWVYIDTVIEYGNAILKTALHIAWESGEMDIVERLLSYDGIDVNSKSLYSEGNEEKKTVLHMAIENGNISMISLLLSHPKIDINSVCKIKNKYDSRSPNITKKTALHMAIENGDISMISLLLSHPKIDINSVCEIKDKYDSRSPNITKKTALHMAIERGNKKIVKLLLSDDRIDVNSMLYYFDDYGNKNKTALHIAVENQNIDIIQKLINHPNFSFNPDCGSSSVFSVAADKGNIDIILLLLNHNKINICQNDEKIIRNYLNTLNEQSKKIDELINK